MDTLDFLQRRRSTKKFGEHAPNAEQIQQIIQAGLRVPDHGRLKPYQFFIFEKQGIDQLERHLEAAAVEFELGEEGAMKAKKLSRRAPMVITVVAKITKDIPKVPAWEQMLTAGCATYAMQLAANAQGFETCWITNKWVNGSALRQALHCQDQDKIVALILIGSPLDQDGITLATQPEQTDGFVTFIQ